MITIEGRDGRLTLLNIEGTHYAATMSTSVMLALEDQGIDIETAFNGGPNRFHSLITLAAKCIDAGARWAKKTSGKEFPTISEEDLADTVDFSEIGEFTLVLKELMTGGKRTVEAKPPKN